LVGCDFDVWLVGRIFDGVVYQVMYHVGNVELVGIKDSGNVM
jgi:hypothetical protein